MTEPQRLPTDARKRRNPANGQYVHKLSEQLIRSICGAIGTGSSKNEAAITAGVHRATFFRWMENGQNGGTRLERTLVAEVEKAVATAIAADLSTIRAHAEKDWRAAAWRLERMHRDQFGPSVALDANVQHEHRHTLELGKLDEQELAALEQLLSKAVEPTEQAGELLQLPRGSE